MKSRYYTFVLYSLILLMLVCGSANASGTNKEYFQENFLSKPTGQYGVGFEDFHWINKNACPDYNFNGKNQNDFSANNKNHCHEIMARIYYPTTLKNYAHTPYYRPIIEVDQNTLRKIPSVTSEQIKKLAEIKSYSVKKAPIATNKIFPVLLFSPGFGCPAQLYENLITELVSQGYIVVGINTLFISGDIELPNGHVVYTAILNSDKAINNVLYTQAQDFSYVFKQLHVLHQSNSVFSAMDLKHIGAFGHSIGGKTIANVSKIHPHWLQAIAMLDMASHKANDSVVKISIPHMHIISAYWKSFFSWPLTYQLEKNGYLVTLSPTAQNKHYSYHMNYTDFSTLQYLPAYKASMAYEKMKQTAEINIKLSSHVLRKKDIIKLNKPTYVLVKKGNSWNIFYYEPGNKTMNFDADMIRGLDIALNNLPNKIPKQLTPLEIKSVKQVITLYHRGFGNYLGNGDGFKISNAINIYLVNFFNTFLKDKKNSSFKNCVALTNDTYMKCGPGQA